MGEEKTLQQVQTSKQITVPFRPHELANPVVLDVGLADLDTVSSLAGTQR